MNEVWDLEEAPVPPRSRLYHLEPIGVGTPYAESLTSYIMRLAGAHCVTPKILVTYEILPHLGPPGRSKTSRQYSYYTWSANAHTLNGTSTISEKCVHTLENLTGWNNLSTLTMLTWTHVVRKRGLVRNTQAWCPFCFEEWQTNKDTIYYPLLWSLSAVKLCLRHQQALRNRCPYQDCQRTFPVFAASLRLGYCLYCRRWLGCSPSAALSSGEAECQTDFEESTWNTAAVGELIEVAPSLSSGLQRENLATAISFFIDRTPSKNVASLARQLNISKGTVVQWQKAANAPQFDTLLLISRLLGTTPRNFLLKTLTTTSFAPVKRGSDVHPIILREKRSGLSSEELRQSLESVLISDEKPSPSVDEVASRLGYRSSTALYHRFPSLCRSITARHLEHYNIEHLRPDLEAFLDFAVPSPSLGDVAKHLGCPAKVLRNSFPELCRAISRRRKLRYEPIDIEGLRAALQRELLSNGEPRSMRQVAKDLGYPIHTFLRLFPDICHEITTRGQEQ